MGEASEIDRLKTKHLELEEAISTERGRPAPDSVVISSLKKEKLRVKDEIYRLSSD